MTTETNQLNYCPCCGLNLRNVLLAMNFKPEPKSAPQLSTISAEPKNKPGPKPKVKGASMTEEERESIWNRFKEGASAYALAEEMFAKKGVNQLTTTSFLYKRRKREQAIKPNE